MAEGSTTGAQLTEADLARRARRGEADAWEAIVGLHREAVFRYAYLQVGDPSEAEDVAQEAFVRAYRSFDRFDSGRPMRPWLLRIARNVARNRWRSWTRRVRAIERWTKETEWEVADLPAHTAGDLSYAAETLRQTLEGMREEDRQVIYLRIHLGLSVEEAGEILEIPPGTVKSRLSRALGRLRETLERDHPGFRRVLDE